MIDLGKLEVIAKDAPRGEWEVWTSNSWRRVMARDKGDVARVIEPTTHPKDKWPDLIFGNGVQAYLEAMQPATILALIAEVGAARATPMQPLVVDHVGTIRFKENAIVRYLLDNGGIDMNQLARVDSTDADREQFAQLIGYSVSGYGELHYVSDESYNVAARLAEQIDEGNRSPIDGDRSGQSQMQSAAQKRGG
jgi:hypothetical protein